MKSVYIIDPYYSDSHRFWAETIAANLEATVRIFQKSPVHWKWRMEGAAIEIAKNINSIDHTPDAFLVTDFLNLGLFKSLLQPRFTKCRFVLYMHENQLTYPVSEKDSDRIENRDKHYGFMNYTSCIVADHIAFNSNYHKNSFINGLNKLSSQLPDKLDVSSIKEKSSIIFSIIDTQLFHKPRIQNEENKVILWNHRWEYDKRPDVFFDALIDLKNKGINFRLILLGKMNDVVLKQYSEQLITLKPHIIHLGFASTKDDYYRLISLSDIIVSTAIHDFFGISVLEGIYAGCRPVLPKDLAYPELVPDKIHNRIFYKRVNLLQAIENGLSDKWTIEDQEIVRNYTKKRFVWEIVKEQYESVLGLA